MPKIMKIYLKWFGKYHKTKKCSPRLQSLQSVQLKNAISTIKFGDRKKFNECLFEATELKTKQNFLQHYENAFWNIDQNQEKNVHQIVSKRINIYFYHSFPFSSKHTTSFWRCSYVVWTAKTLLQRPNNVVCLLGFSL